MSFLVCFLFSFFFREASCRDVEVTGLRHLCEEKEKGKTEMSSGVQSITARRVGLSMLWAAVSRGRVVHALPAGEI